jgi:hypothetical protein
MTNRRSCVKPAALLSHINGPSRSIEPDHRRLRADRPELSLSLDQHTEMSRGRGLGRPRPYTARWPTQIVYRFASVLLICVTT